VVCSGTLVGRGEERRARSISAERDSMSGSAGARGSCDAAGTSKWAVVVRLWPIWPVHEGDATVAELAKG
jgi:hypothetical protein